MAIQAHLYTYPNNTGFPLCGSQGLMTDFNSQHQLVSSAKPLEQQHLQRLYNSERQRNQTMPVNPALLLVANSNAYNATNNYNSNHLSTPNSQSFAVEFESQRGEVDHYIWSQNEKLRIMLQEQRKQQVAALLKKVEMDAVGMLRQKDEQIAQAAKKRAELEEFLTRLEADNVSWRRVAQENEALVLSLHSTLEQIKERNCYRYNNNSNSGMGAEDAESCCDESRSRREEGTGENRVSCAGEGEAQAQAQAQHVAARKTMVCRSCNGGSSCLMFLPCRHLCCCKACEPFLEACPVCRMPKKSTIETLLF